MNGPPPGLEIKAATVLERPTGALTSVNPLGVVTALVAVTGVQDQVGDVIPAGAFERTLRERRPHPRLLHDWHRQIGNTTALCELPPGHAELPKQAPDGRPWPREAGALVARYQLDLSTKDGRRALAWAQGKLGAPPWYSIGYVPVRTRFINGARYLDDLDLWEYSMVHRPANDLAFQVDIKSLPSLIDSEQELPPESIEVKVSYVRDSGYWGYPVGTPITGHMKPKGRTAVGLRRTGRIPARSVGTTTTKPAEGARSKPAKPGQEEPEGLFPEPTVDTRVRASRAATGDIDGAVTTLIGELEEAERGRDNRVEQTIEALLHEGLTPLELEEDLRASRQWASWADDAERDDLIESALADYRSAYRARAAQQLTRRTNAADWTPPSRESLDRIAAQATTALESFEEKSLAAALAELGHDDPEGFAAHLTGENTKMKQATTELAEFIAAQRARTESSGDITERLGDLSKRDDQDLLDFRRTVADELGTDDEAVMAAAEAAVDAEIERRGIIALRDVKPGDVFDFNDQRYYVAPDGSLVDPEGERANLPRSGYQGRAATLIERDAPMPIRKVDAEQLAAVDEHVLSDAPAAGLGSAEYHQRSQLATARRVRAENIAEEQQQADREAGYAAVADALADAAPAQIDVDALRGRRALIGQQSERRLPVELAGGGRVAVVGSGSKNWSIVTGSGLSLVNSSAFTESQSGKPPGKRALADLAHRLAALTDAQGRPAPFTATYEQQGESDRPDWIRGWRDGQDRSLVEASAEAIGAWAEQNNLTFRYPAGNYRSAPTVPGGAPDADGFRLRRIDYLHREVAPGDEIRLPDGTVVTVADTAKSETITLADGRALTETDIGRKAGLGGGIVAAVRFAGDPDDPQTRRDPGMGPIPANATPPGAPITGDIEQRWPYEYDRPYPTGTRLAIVPATEPGRGLMPRDNSARVGTLLARIEHVQGNDFQTVRFDDGTYDQIRVGALRSTSTRPDSTTYVPNPSPEQINAGRADWGLPPDDNATPIPVPRARRAPAPRPAPVPVPVPRQHGPEEPEPAAELPTPDPDSVSDAPRPPDTWRLMFTRQDTEQARAEFAQNGWRIRDVRERDRDRWLTRLEALGWTVHAFPPKVEEPPEPEPAAPAPPVVEIPQDQLDAATDLSDELFGITEQPDGTLEVDVAVADRQDRVAALLEQREAGALTLAERGLEELTATREDLHAELGLQMALERRQQRAPAPAPRARGAGGSGQPPAEGPKQRPGLIGAAQDHAEALRSGDAEAITRTKARLESSLRRSRAASDTARQLADHVTADTPNDAAAIADLAERLKKETRERRAASARKRRTVRRLEREQIRSLLGEVDVELRSRAAARERADADAKAAAEIAARQAALAEAEALRARAVANRPTGSPEFTRGLSDAVKLLTVRGRRIGNVQAHAGSGRVAVARGELGSAVQDLLDSDRATTALRALLSGPGTSRGKERSRDGLVATVAQDNMPTVLRSSPDSQRLAQDIADRMRGLAAGIRSAGAEDPQVARVILEPLRMDEVADELEQVAGLIEERIAVVANRGRPGTPEPQPAPGGDDQAKFDADLAAITRLSQHRYATGKQISDMIKVAPQFAGPGGNETDYAKRNQKSLRFWLQHGRYDQARIVAESLEGSEAIVAVPGLRKMIDDMQFLDRGLSADAPFPPATGGNPAKRAELHREMLQAVRGVDPGAVSQLGGLSIEPRNRGPKSGDAWYSRWPDGSNRLSVRTEQFDPAMKASRMQYEKSGWFVPSGFDNYLTRALNHELGHHLHYTARSEGREPQMFAEIAEELGVDPPSPGQQPLAWVKANTATLVTRVGTYAADSDAELIAELWTEYRGRGSEASPVAQIVGRHLSKPITSGTAVPEPPVSPSIVSIGPAAPPLSDEEYRRHSQQVEVAIATALADGRASDVTYTVEGAGAVWLPERAAQHREVIDALWSRANAVPNDGRAMLSGGLGGAGKSTVLRTVVSPEDYFTINSDDVKEEMARRGMIPEVPGLSPMESVALIHEESGHLANLLAARAYASHKNVIWDVTMGSANSTRRRLTELRAAGYDEVNAVFVDIPLETSVDRALSRHRQGMERHRSGDGLGGRFVPPEVIRSHASPTASSINRTVFDGLREEFDSWAIFDNSVHGRPPKLLDNAGTLVAQPATRPASADMLAVNYLRMHGAAGVRSKIVALSRGKRSAREEELLAALREVLDAQTALAG